MILKNKREVRMEKSRSEQKEFKQVTISSRGRRVSALYNTLEDLIKTKNPQLSAYEIQHSAGEKKSVFYSI